MISMIGYICVIRGLEHILKGCKDTTQNVIRLGQNLFNVNRHLQIQNQWDMMQYCLILLILFMWNIHYFRFIAMKMIIQHTPSFAHLGHRVLLCLVPSVCPSVSLSVHPSRLCYHYTAHNISWILFTCGSAIGINMRMNPNDGFLC